MLIDTHCHINIMVKKDFDRPLTTQEINDAQKIISGAQKNNVNIIINVGTSLVESKNCIALAQNYPDVFATAGIHPNDLTTTWLDDFKVIKQLVTKHKENKIVGIGEIGLDRHYPDFNLPRQIDAFKAHIDLALEYDLGLVVHTRDAAQETLKVLEEYKSHITRGIIHCFSEDQYFASQVISWGFVIGIGGTITYPKNNLLREVVTQAPLDALVLETDAPFLPPQEIRGKQNSPAQIKPIAEYIAELKKVSIDDVAQVTTTNAKRIFNLENLS